MVILSQIANVLVSLTIFIDSAFALEKVRLVERGLLFWILIGISNVVSVVVVMMKIKKIQKKYIRGNLGIIVILVIRSLIQIPFLNYTQRWDAGWYWRLLHSSIESFDLTINTFLPNFNWLGHSSMGYSGLMAITQFFGGESKIWLSVGNLCLSLLAIKAFHEILNYFNNKRKSVNLWITLIFALNPLSIATSISFNIDFPVLIFTVLMFESWLYKKYIYFIVYSGLIIFSKETGWLIYLSFLGINIVIFGVNYLRKMVVRNDLWKLLVIFLPVALMIGYWFYFKGNFWSNGIIGGGKLELQWNNSCLFCFGLEKGNVITRLFQIFGLNFSWILSAVTLLVLLKFIVRKEIKFNSFVTNKKLQEFIVILFVFVSLLIFNLTFITMTFARYMVPLVFFTTLFFGLAFNYLVKDGKRIRIMLPIISILFLGQIFRSIDILPKRLFGGNSLNSRSSAIFGYYDGLVYNTEFVFVDKLAKKINKLIGDSIVYGDSGSEYLFEDIKILGGLDDAGGLRSFKYIHVPWLAEKSEVMENILKNYSIGKQERIGYNGYYVEVYDLGVR
ncbi:MAG: hypothetical protein WCV93_02470 [Candidatus Shapirobacteria bacterium]